jgi:hypothetical protein
MRYRQLRSAGSIAIGKPYAEGFGKYNIRTLALRSPARAVGYIFHDKILTDTVPTRGRGGVYEIFLGERGHGRISGGPRVLDLAAGSRKAAPRQSAR